MLSKLILVDPIFMKYLQYLGVLLGALYGILFRMLNGVEAIDGFYNLYSITFVWITPIVISLIPVFFFSTGLYKSKIKLVVFPVVAVLLFWVIALSTRLEDLLCILIIGFPFLLVAGMMGLLLGWILEKIKINNKKMYSIVFLPLLLNPLENMLPDKAERYVVEQRIRIAASREVIWPNVIEVPEITENEYQYGFFNYVGVPRPVKSILEEKEGEVFRIGYFTDGLKLCETISDVDQNKFVNFKIHIGRSQLRDKPTDQHLLRSNHFRFENISYKLNAVSNTETELVLTCEYQLESKMNGYANFWAGSIIRDFEKRLLEALKRKIELP